MINSIRFAWIVSVVATLGSLYFSEVLGWIPCILCWYQRILMYPMSIILGVSVYKNDTKVIPYILPLPIIGLCISTFHYLKQHLPSFAEIGSCDVGGVSCTTDYIGWFGFITIPFLAGTAFLLILITFIYELKKIKRSQNKSGFFLFI